MDEKIITSVQNNKIKQLRSLKQKQSRDDLNMFSAEGDKVIHDAICAGLTATDIFVQDTKIDKFDKLLSLAMQKNIPVNIVNEKIMSAISQTKSPQGVAATFYKKQNSFSHEVLKDARFVAILEEIKDPGNLGTIIRTCDAVGVDLIIMENCTDIYNNKVIRASMGSIFNLPCYIVSLRECISQMAAGGWQIGCGHLDGDNFYNRKQLQNVALVIGNETRGITDETAGLCTHLWKLPMNGEADSLNASIAAGIMLYDIHNKLSTFIK